MCVCVCVNVCVCVCVRERERERDGSVWHQYEITQLGLFKRKELLVVIVSWPISRKSYKTFFSLSQAVNRNKLDRSFLKYFFRLV